MPGEAKGAGVEIVDDLIFIIGRSIFSGLAGKFYYSVIVFVLLLISNMQIACQLWLKLFKHLISNNLYCFCVLETSGVTLKKCQHTTQ